MKASIVDLRYRMKDVLRALKQKERVHILYHGKEAGIIIPAPPKSKIKAVDHPFVGSDKSTESVEKKMKKLRASRYAF